MADMGLLIPKEKDLYIHAMHIHEFNNDLKCCNELGGHYNRSRQVVFNTEKEFRTLKIGKANKFHIDLIELYNSLDKEISVYIKSLKKSRK